MERSKTSELLTGAYYKRPKSLPQVPTWATSQQKVPKRWPAEMSRVHQNREKRMRLVLKSLIREYFRNVDRLNSLNENQQRAVEELNIDDQLQFQQHQQKRNQQVKGSDYFTLHGTFETTSVKLYAIWILKNERAIDNWRVSTDRSQGPEQPGLT